MLQLILYNNSSFFSISALALYTVIIGAFINAKLLWDDSNRIKKSDTSLQLLKLTTVDDSMQLPNSIKRTTIFQSSQKICTRCKTKLNDETAPCQFCGYQSVTLLQAAKGNIICSGCKTPISSQFKKCPFCANHIIDST